MGNSGKMAFISGEQLRDKEAYFLVVGNTLIYSRLLSFDRNIFIYFNFVLAVSKGIAHIDRNDCRENAKIVETFLGRMFIMIKDKP